MGGALISGSGLQAAGEHISAVCSPQCAGLNPLGGLCPHPCLHPSGPGRCGPVLRPRGPLLPPAHRPSDLALPELTVLVPPRSAGSAAAGHEWSTACPWCHTDGPRGPPQENGSSLFGVLVCLSSYCCNISVPKTPNFHHFSESSSVLHIRIIGPPLPSATSRTSSVS